MDILTALEKLFDRFGKKYKSREIVFEEGEKNDEMYFVLSGEVEVLKKIDGGEPKILGKISSGAFFGEMSLLTGEQRSATIRVSQDDTRIIRISPGNFDTIIKLQPQIAINMLRVISERLRKTNQLLSEKAKQ